MKEKIKNQMPKTNIIEMLRESSEFISKKIKTKTEIGIILGSGLGDFTKILKNKKVVKYESIPHFPKASVAGHKGNLVFGKCGEKNVLVMQGRWHCYEGYSAKEVSFGVRVWHKLGVRILIVTNSAGALNKNFEIGDIVIINDHINFLCESPLEAYDSYNSFVDLSNVYDIELIEKAKESLERNKLPFKTGVYLATRGPNYETPAEIRMMKTLGAELVGMSTIPEVITARQLKIKVLAFSLVTNYAAGISSEKLSHKEVLEITSKSAQKVRKFLGDMLQNL